MEFVKNLQNFLQSCNKSLINQTCSGPCWKNIGPRSFLYGPRCARSVLSRPGADILPVRPSCLVNKIYIKHNGHLRTRGKCRQHEPQASVFYISRVFSNVRSVLSQSNTRLRLLHLLYDIEVMWRKTIKHAFSMFYTLIKHGFFTNQSERSMLSTYTYTYTYIHT